MRNRYRSDNDEEDDTHLPLLVITGVMTHPGVSAVLAWRMDKLKLRLARQVESM
jgi:hypothetical protein